MNKDYDHIIKKAVDTHLPGYDWRLYKAQLYQESLLNPKAVSHKGAGGIAQFTQDTWSDWSPKSGYADKNRFDPEASIMTGAMYMAHLINEWDWPRPEVDRLCLAMASYNAGLGNILKAQKLANDVSDYASIIAQLPKVTSSNGDRDAEETTTYVKRILGYCNDLVTGD